MNSLTWKAAALAAATLLSACANLAPEYRTPAAAVPAQWPQPAATPAAATPAATVGADIGWRDFVQDERLRGTLALALDQSRPLRLAVLAIEKARATYDIQAAATLPTVQATASSSQTRTPAQASSSGQSSISRSTSLSVGVSAYELDFFGRVRNLKDAALESYLATEEARRSTQIALVSEVATAWLTLQSDQALLALARQTLESEGQTYTMTERRQALGADSALTLAQARTSVEGARRDVAAYEAQVQQDRNALNLLVGTAVPERLLPSAQQTDAATALVAVPAALPSEVLRQRPDVQAAEHTLKAANADIGAARAARFPTISLTTSVGTASRSLSDLFQGGTWSFVPSVTGTLFDGGAARAAVRAAEVELDIQVATYDQTLQTAFREVADALAVRATLAERLDAQAAVVQAAERSLTLSTALWRGGASSYLDVLDAQRTVYTARQALISLRLAEQTNRTTLFAALGGGWNETTPSPSTTSPKERQS